MAEVKLTKNALKDEQKRLKQLEKYLPTLQLKKAMLQAEVNAVRLEISNLDQLYTDARENAEGFGELLTEHISIDPVYLCQIREIIKKYENIAGVDVPSYLGVSFAPITYSLFDTPAWVDAAIVNLRSVAEAKAQVIVAKEKKDALEHELREVSIRVNLFEKILIPRAHRNIKKIKVFLGDQQLSAVAQAKSAKAKIQKRQLAHAI